MLENLPKRTKYAYEDQVFIIIDSCIVPVEIASWRVHVYDTVGDGTGTAVQKNYYKFTGYEEFELPENKIFSSENHALGFIKGDFINRAFESGTGGSGFFQGGFNVASAERSFGNWTDLASLDLKLAQFKVDDQNILSGLATWTNGSATILGTNTLFLSQVHAGDTIYIDEMELVVDHVVSNTELVLTAAMPAHLGTLSKTNGTAIITSSVDGFGVGYFGDIEIGDGVTATGVSGNRIADAGDSSTQRKLNSNSTGTASGLSYTVTHRGRGISTALESQEVELLYESDDEKTLVFDGTIMTDAILPDLISDPSDNWADFRANVRSYDALTTVMPDGYPIGHPDD